MIDTVSYGDHAPAEEVTEEPEETPSETIPSEDEEEETDTSTPPTCSDLQTLELLSLLPDPTGEEETDEMIVIKNTDTETICLDGWVIRDLSKSHTLSGELDGSTTLELPRSITNIALNNTSAETVELVAPDGTVVDSATYEKAIEGAVYTQVDGAWEWTGLSSGTEQPIVSEDDSSDAGDTEDSSASDTVVKKTLLKKQGVVIALPDTFGSQIMYIDGLQLYQYQGEFPDLQIGDVIEVVGTPSKAHGESRLKIADADAITVVGNESVTAASIVLKETESYLGRLVEVTGKVTERSAGRFTLEKDGVRILVIVKEGTGISLSSITLGAELKVTGVVATYDGTVRLMPRSSTDIETVVQALLSAPTPPPRTNPNRTLGLTLAGMTTSAVGARAWWWKRHKKVTA